MSDYPALRQLGQSLWRTEGARGAALLVGAGVSRGALLSGDDLPPPPLWGDLARAMREELYPTQQENAPNDPLRLAEEYRTYFGQAALDSFIRRHIPDTAWHPSSNHKTLLDLPWSDVLTTNYDTLLERAALSSKRFYEPVLIESDIAHARAPRIVKLHGSIGVSEHFVIAEEDYRTYPRRFGAFVNLARQVFVENELCLLGFSGDDPNFLAWSGWVRDHLSSSARRIYLVGALNLGPAKRKFLEAHNIAPIDFYDAVKHLDNTQRHSAATELLIRALAALEPAPAHAWSPCQSNQPDSSSSLEEKASQVVEAIDLWEADRRSYPGWLICPHSERLSLRWATDSVPLYANVLELLPSQTAARAIAEFCWRHVTAHWPLSMHELALIEKFFPIDDSSTPQEDRLLVARCLIRQPSVSSGSATFAAASNAIKELAEPNSDALAELYYEIAVRACAEMDFSKAVSTVDAISGPDPVWRLRRAAILFETGHLERGAALVSEAVHDLKERERTNRRSLWIKSRLAWATLMARACRQDRLEQSPWVDRFRESRCDPWQEVDSIKDEIAREIRKRSRKPNRITPKFEPGSYFDPSRTITFGSSTSVEPNYALNRVLIDGGIPPSLLRLNLFRDDRLDALELDFRPTAEWYLDFIRSGPSRSDPLLDRYFSRVSVATMPADLVSDLGARLEEAWEFWTARLNIGGEDDRSFAIDQLSLVIELLGRIVVRMPSEAAAEMHRHAVSFWAQAPRQGFVDSISRLLSNSFSATQPALRPALAAASLRLPLTQHSESPDPLGWLDGGALPASVTRALSADVEQWLEIARQDCATRGAAINRLMYVQSVGGLSKANATRFASVAWSVTDAGNPPLPNAPSVYPHFWAKLPAPKGVDAKRAVRDRLFATEGHSPDRQHLYTMIRAARNGVGPTPEMARSTFDALVKTRPAPVNLQDITARVRAAFTGYDAQDEANAIGAALTYAVIPFLSEPDKTTSRATALTSFIEQTEALSAAGGLLYFLNDLPELVSDLHTMVRRGLVSRSKRTVGYAADVLYLWTEQKLSSELSVPGQLIEQLISVIELRRSTALWRLLSTATALARTNRFNDTQCAKLSTALSDLLVETQYSAIDAQTEEAGEISLVRKQAVQLALALQKSGHGSEAIFAWCALTKTDPLPEVRYAEADDH